MQSTELSEIINNISSIKDFFKGIYSIDNVPKRLKKYNFVVINNQTSTERGQHWFCIIKSDLKKYEYFDSLGVTKEKLDLLKSYRIFPYHSIVKYNETSVQDFTSSTCGLYVLYFIINRLHNLDLSFTTLINEIFTIDPLKNEDLVKKFALEFLNYSL